MITVTKEQYIEMYKAELACVEEAMELVQGDMDMQLLDLRWRELSSAIEDLAGD